MSKQRMTVLLSVCLAMLLLAAVTTTEAFLAGRKARME